MKPEQITALAREYAEFTDMSPVDKKNISAICECFLKFVLRRYCLVEKAKVREEYEDNYVTPKDADTVIQGWVAINEAYNECYLHTNKPTPEIRPIADTGDYDSYWGSEGQTYLLDADLFPDMDSDSDPQEVEITIKRKKNE